jgi:hypothetical protein
LKVKVELKLERSIKQSMGALEPDRVLRSETVKLEPVEVEVDDAWAKVLEVIPHTYIRVEICGAKSMVELKEDQPL